MDEGCYSKIQGKANFSLFCPIATNSRFFRLNPLAGGAHNQECDSNRNEWPLN